MDKTLDHLLALTQKQIALRSKIEASEKKENILKAQRSQHESRIKIEQMDEKHRYDQLKHESKIVMNIIKMISNRAETSVANLLIEYLPDYWKDRKRMLVKQIIQANADLICR